MYVHVCTRRRAGFLAGAGRESRHGCIAASPQYVKLQGKSKGRQTRCRLDTHISSTGNDVTLWKLSWIRFGRQVRGQAPWHSWDVAVCKQESRLGTKVERGWLSFPKQSLTMSSVRHVTLMSRAHFGPVGPHPDAGRLGSLDSARHKYVLCTHSSQVLTSLLGPSVHLQHFIARSTSKIAPCMQGSIAELGHK